MQANGTLELLDGNPAEDAIIRTSGGTFRITRRYSKGGNDFRGYSSHDGHKQLWEVELRGNTIHLYPCND